MVRPAPAVGHEGIRFAYAGILHKYTYAAGGGAGRGVGTNVAVNRNVCACVYTRMYGFQY